METFIKKLKKKKNITVDKQIVKLMEERTPLVEQCMKTEEGEEGKVIFTFCSRADGKFCGVYAFPGKKWALGCPLADEFLRIITEDQKAADRVRVGQQKQKKKTRK
ncbi:MAG TPA: hypothetical protein VMX17_08540 [Candidatus Glassbacteria bacterium]|nr:hypothetical protein [Candidatus Glassbacteria bacterium]